MEPVDEWMTGDTNADGFPLRIAPPRDREIGMAYFASSTDGIGGRIKRSPEDFCVEEISSLDVEPVEADPDAYPFLVVRVGLTGWDTHDFVARLSDSMGISRKRISWAGTKDKHAVTSQRMAIRTVQPEALPTIRNARIEPIGRFGRALTFGDLVGNAFEIRITDPSNPDRHERITSELRVLGDDRIAVPNYFGPQRFGSQRAVTHRVGLAIVRGDWEGAVVTYLAHSDESEPPETRRFRRSIEASRDWEAALERCPTQLGFERTLLQYLVEGADENPYRAALDRLPETLCQLFVHAAQSYIFNRIVSTRLEEGLPLHRAVAGDVVCFGSSHDRIGPVPEPKRTQAVTEQRIETVNRHVRNGRAWVTGPLVGTDSPLDGSIPGTIVEHVLDELDLAPGDFDLPAPYASTGARRPLLASTVLTISMDPLVFSFALPSGTYATTVVREYLKSDRADEA